MSQLKRVFQFLQILPQFLKFIPASHDSLKPFAGLSMRLARTQAFFGGAGSFICFLVRTVYGRNARTGATGLDSLNQKFISFLFTGFGRANINSLIPLNYLFLIS